MMLANWMLGSLIAAGLLGLAGLAVESVLHRWRIQTRFFWAVMLSAIAVLAIVPLPARAGGASGSPGLEVGSVVGGLGPLAAVQATMSVGMPTDPTNALKLGWALATVGVLAYLLAGYWRLRRLRREWVRAEIDGVEVLLSEDVGPAVVGVRRVEIVMPRWVTHLGGMDRRLMIRHEVEHLRGGDTHLWLGGLAMIAAFPWNPVVWWMVHRLRSAIEMDCDQRVLVSTGDVRAYGALLVELAGRCRALPLAAAAMADRMGNVERRLRAMTRPVARYRTPVTLVGSILAIGLVVTACELSRPAGIAEPDRALQVVEDADQAGSPGAEPPMIAPSESAPSGPAAEAAGEPQEESTRAASDAAEPATPMARSAPEPSSLRQAPEFDTRPGTEPAPGVDLSAEPAFTPRMVNPTLRNREEFIAALERSYPPLLKDAGIGGTIVLWIFIDEEGIVRNTRIVTGSGEAILDRAAENLMLNVARFTPALNEAAPVPVWVQIPVTFAVR
jgi:TonB family protein